MSKQMDATEFLKVLEAYTFGSLGPLLQRQPELAHVRFEAHGGQTALMRAAQLRDKNKVLALLPWSNINALDHAGRNALLWALSAGAADCVQLLAAQTHLGHESEIGIPRRQSIRSKPERTDASHTALGLAATLENSECLDILLPHCTPALINQRDRKGFTALMHAVCKGSVPNVERLARVSRMELRNKHSQQTALMMCATSNPEALRVLLPVCSNAVCALQDEHGFDALMLAVVNQPSSVQALLGRSNLSQQNREGHTALMLALRREVVKGRTGGESTVEVVESLASHSSLEQLRLRDSYGHNGFEQALARNTGRCVDVFAPILTEEEARATRALYPDAEVPRIVAVCERHALSDALNPPGSSQPQLQRQPQQMRFQKSGLTSANEDSTGTRNEADARPVSVACSDSISCVKVCESASSVKDSPVLIATVSQKSKGFAKQDAEKQNDRTEEKDVGRSPEASKRGRRL